MPDQIIDIDFTWKNPSEAQVYALQYATVRLQEQNINLVGYGINEFMIAEMMCVGRDNLWYIQCKRWAEGKGIPYSGVDQIFLLGSQAIMDLANTGWQEQDKSWYNPVKTFADPIKATIAITTAIEMCRLIKENRGRTSQLISVSFDLLPYLLFDGLKVDLIIRDLKNERGVKRVMGLLYDHYKGVWGEDAKD